MERYGNPKWETQKIRNITTTNVQGVLLMFWINLPRYASLIFVIAFIPSPKPSMPQPEKSFKPCGTNAIERGKTLWKYPLICSAQLLTLHFLLLEIGKCVSDYCQKVCENSIYLTITSILIVLVTPLIENGSSSCNAYVQFFGSTIIESGISRYLKHQKNFFSDIFVCTDTSLSC